MSHFSQESYNCSLPTIWRQNCDIVREHHFLRRQLRVSSFSNFLVFSLTKNCYGFYVTSWNCYTIFYIEYCPEQQGGWNHFCYSNNIRELNVRSLKPYFGTFDTKKYVSSDTKTCSSRHLPLYISLFL